MYLPDAIASYQVNGAHLPDHRQRRRCARRLAGLQRRDAGARVLRANGLDPAVFPDANLLLDSNLGRLRITSSPNGGSTGKNAAGQCNELWAFGARSFSIWSADVARVYDSGDEFEQRTRALPNVNFNAGHEDNTLDAPQRQQGPGARGRDGGQVRQQDLRLHRARTRGRRDGLRREHARQRHAS